MGSCQSNKCSSAKTRRKSYNTKIEYQNANTEIPELDDPHKEMTDLLKEIENLRRRFSLKWNDFILETGVIVLQNPSIKSGLIGYTYRFSHEITEKNVKSITFDLTTPWFKFEEDYSLTKKARQFLIDIDTFLQFAYSIQNETSTLYSSYKIKFDTLKVQFDEFKYEGLLHHQEKEKVAEKISKILEIYVLAWENISIINNIISKLDSDLKSFQTELIEKELRNDLLTICAGAGNKNSEDDPMTFVWKYTNEKRLPNLTDARIRKAEMRLNKEEIEKEEKQKLAEKV